MEPMKPMQPMKPMEGAAPWWPKHLGDPASTGSQDGLRYAFFPDKKRLLVEMAGSITTYDSGGHDIRGVSQGNGPGGPVTFTDQGGTVDLDSLDTLD